MAASFVGSCMGTVTGNLLSPACGDLSGSSTRVLAGVDSATVILPLLISFAVTNPIVRAWNEWVIICLIFIYFFVAIFPKNHRKFYGIKIVLPLYPLALFFPAVFIGISRYRGTF